MEKVKLLEFFKEGLNFEYTIPANTSVANLHQAIALFIIDSSKYRGVKTTTTLAEIEQWVTQLEENQ